MSEGLTLEVKYGIIIIIIIISFYVRFYCASSSSV